MLKKKIAGLNYDGNKDTNINNDKATQAVNLFGRECYVDETVVYIPFDYGAYSYGFLGRFETINGQAMYCLLFPKNNFTYIN